MGRFNHISCHPHPNIHQWFIFSKLLWDYSHNCSRNNEGLFSTGQQARHRFPRIFMTPGSWKYSTFYRRSVYFKKQSLKYKMKLFFLTLDAGSVPNSSLSVNYPDGLCMCCTLSFKAASLHAPSFVMHICTWCLLAPSSFHTRISASQSIWVLFIHSDHCSVQLQPEAFVASQ